MLFLLYSPLVWVILLIAGLFACWSRIGRRLRAVGLVSVGLLMSLLTPLGGNLLVRYVESRLPAGLDCATAARDWPATVPIVLMSAGFDTDPATDDVYVALSTESWRRLRNAVLMWQEQPGTPLYIAGGGPFATRESTVLARLAQDWGVPASALHVEDQSTSTWESAFAMREMLGGRVRVVSSAVHLPRSLVAFRAAGFEACGQPSDSDYQPPGGPGYFIPQLSGLRKSELALHELLGAWWYDYRARMLLRVPPTSAAPVPGAAADLRGAPTVWRQIGRLPSTTSIPPSDV